MNAAELDEHGFQVPATHRRAWARRPLEQASTESIPALIELRDQGVISAIGAGMNQTAMLTEFVRRYDIDIVMLAGLYTLLDRSAAADLLPLAQERGVGVVAAAVYNSGLLSRAEVADDTNFDYLPASADLIAKARAIAEVCRAHGVTLPDAAVQFALRQPAVVSVVLGTSTAEQARQGVERYSVDIPEALWADLDTIGVAGSSTTHP